MLPAVSMATALGASVSVAVKTGTPSGVNSATNPAEGALDSSDPAVACIGEIIGVPATDPATNTLPPGPKAIALIIPPWRAFVNTTCPSFDTFSTNGK